MGAKSGGAVMKWTGRCLRMKLGDDHSGDRHELKLQTAGLGSGDAGTGVVRVRCARASVLRYE